MRTFEELVKTAQKLMEEMEALGEQFDNKCIRIWRFKDAPKALQELSENGGDEDWIALVPDTLYKEAGGYFPFLEIGTFGVCCVDRYPIPGYIVFIGSHA